MSHKIQIPPNQRQEFECAECRRLLASGIAKREDQIEFYRGEMKCLSGNVGWFADRTVEETATGPAFKILRPERRGTASLAAKNQSEDE